MNRTIVKLIVLATLALAFWLSDNTPAKAATQSTIKKEYINVSTTSSPSRVHKQEVQTRNSRGWDVSWLATLQRPNNSYWDKVAQCETKSNWKDRGYFAGGLGIALPTWRGFGGQDFAPKQWLATRLEQIIVANRIALHGYQTKEFRTIDDKLANRPFFRPPAGFLGWGCIKFHKNGYLKPPVPSPWEASKKRSKGTEKPPKPRKGASSHELLEVS
jgi:hypothetical protein